MKLNSTYVVVFVQCEICGGSTAMQEYGGTLSLEESKEVCIKRWNLRNSSKM